MWEASVTAGKQWQRNRTREGAEESRETCRTRKCVADEYDGGNALEEKTEQVWAAGTAGKCM